MIFPELELEEDEETLIDKLASLAAGAPASSNIFNDFDLSQLDYLNGAGSNLGFGDLGTGSSSGDIIAKAALANLPRQFGYRPDDLRFYIPSEEFPNYFSTDAHDIKSKINQVNSDKESRFSERQYEPEELISKNPSSSLPQLHMKKNTALEEEASNKNGPGEEHDADNGVASLSENPVPQHNMAMASQHSANHPGGPSVTHISDQPFSIYYIGKLDMICY